MVVTWVCVCVCGGGLLYCLLFSTGRRVQKYSPHIAQHPCFWEMRLGSLEGAHKQK